MLATAHDMGREHRIIAALGPTDVPVPPAVGLCADDAVNGAPFYVMGFVDGHVVRDAETAAAGLDRRRSGAVPASRSSTCSPRIHAVDLDAVGLGDLGRTRGLHRAPAQALVRAVGAVQDPRAAARSTPCTTACRAPCPSRARPRIVHGDYRLDNCIVGDDGDIEAVLDWELCTLGDPLADVGLLMVYWTEPDDAHAALLDAPDHGRGLPTPARAARRATPSRRAGTSRDIDFYVAFGYWKLACIIEGVLRPLRRRRHGRTAQRLSRASPRSSARRLGRGRRRPRSAMARRRSDGRPLRAPSSDPELDEPVLDRRSSRAGSTPASAAADAASSWLDRSTRRPSATFDTDMLLDHRARRPIMHLVDGVNTGLTWPTIELRAGTTPPGTTCCCWSAPSRTTTGASFSRRGASTWPRLRRPAWSSASAPTRRRPPHPARPARLHRRRRASWPGAPASSAGTLDVPAGVQAAIERAAASGGCRPLGLWAQVPHYAAAHALPRRQRRPRRRARRARSPRLDAARLHAEATERPASTS